MLVLNREMLGGKLFFTYLPQTIQLWVSTPLSVLTNLGIWTSMGRKRPEKMKGGAIADPAFSLFAFLVSG